MRAETAASIVSSTYTSFQGPIAAVKSGGGLTLTGTPAQGYVPVTESSSTIVNTYAGSAVVGHYAILVGTGSSGSGYSAAYIATFASQPSTITISGTYAAAEPWGIEIKTSSSGVVPVMTTASTTVHGTLASGATISVSGPGSASGAILATSISVTSNGAVATGPLHVLTAAYLGAPDGSTSVTPAQAARYLTWASTALGNVNATAAAGIKTMVYIDANRTQPDMALYTQAASGSFAQSCSGAKVSDYFDSVTQSLMNNGSAAYRSEYASYLRSWLSGYNVSAVFEDDAVQPGYYAASFWKPGLPCGYTDSTWLANERALQAAAGSAGYDTIFNGLGAFDGEAPAQDIAELQNSSTIGGDLENCYTSTSQPEENEWVWTVTEDTELQVTAKDKDFICLSGNQGDAASSSQSRIWAMASFLMTYNASYSVLWEMYSTPSKFTVLPESQLVPTDPLVATPAAVSSLEVGSTEVYKREYKTCYYAGKAIGACAMVVNDSYQAQPAPALSQTYKHTLAVSGYDVLEGGSVSLDGSAPPTSMPAMSSYIALP